MRATKIIVISCLIVCALFSGTSNAKPTASHSVFIAKAVIYVKVNEAELYSMHDVSYEVVSENEQEIIVGVVGIDTYTKKVFVPELNRFEEHTNVASGGIYLHFCKSDQAIYKVVGMQ